MPGDFTISNGKNYKKIDPLAILDFDAVIY